MAIGHIDLTIGTGSTQLTSTNIMAKWAIVENEAGNDVCYVGGSTVSSSTYGLSVTPGEQAPPLGSTGNSRGLPFNLSTLYFAGTSTNVIHVLYDDE